MKQLIKNYSFNATSKTVTLTDFSTVLLERLQLIVDTTTNTILYNFADSSVAAATVSTNVITLSTVGSASSSDKLMVIYDCANSDPVYGATEPIGGDVADAGTDSGTKPVKVGALYESTLPTYTTGQRATVHTGTRGSINTQLMVSNSAQPVSYTSDNLDTVAASSLGGNMRSSSLNFRLNGTSWDRFRCNEDATLLASSARTTTQTSADLVNYNGISTLAIILDVTSAGTGSITISINGKDPASGKYYNILTGSAVTTTGTNVYRVGPHIAAVANSIAQDYLPRTFQIVVTANNSNSMTYSVGYSLIRA